MQQPGDRKCGCLMSNSLASSRNPDVAAMLADKFGSLKRGLGFRKGPLDSFRTNAAGQLEVIDRQVKKPQGYT